jgi:hypothetical protein
VAEGFLVQPVRIVTFHCRLTDECLYTSIYRKYGASQAHYFFLRIVSNILLYENVRLSFS